MRKLPPTRTRVPPSALWATAPLLKGYRRVSAKKHTPTPRESLTDCGTAACNCPTGERRVKMRQCGPSLRAGPGPCGPVSMRWPYPAGGARILSSVFGLRLQCVLTHLMWRSTLILLALVLEYLSRPQRGCKKGVRRHEPVTSPSPGTPGSEEFSTVVCESIRRRCESASDGLA